MLTVESHKYMHEGLLRWGVAWYFTSSSEEESTVRVSPEQASDDGAENYRCGGWGTEKPVLLETCGRREPAGAPARLLEQDPRP